MADFLTTTSAMPVYMIYPRFLMDMDLSEMEKLVYVVLLDRARLSMSNGGWEDESGHVFLIYPIKALAEALHKSEMTIKRALAVRCLVLVSSPISLEQRLLSILMRLAKSISDMRFV